MAHIRVQKGIERPFAQKTLADPASIDLIRSVHWDFYKDAPETALQFRRSDGVDFRMVPGEFRSEPEQDIAVGLHQPPTSKSVSRFMEYFHARCRSEALGLGMKIVGTAAAHHRFNYVHPYAMALNARHRSPQSLVDLTWAGARPNRSYRLHAHDGPRGCSEAKRH